MFVRLQYSGSINNGKVVIFNGELVNMGTADDNHVIIDDKTESVSPYHAQIHRHLESVILVDMGAPEGTFCNGTSVTRCELHNGDTIKLGKTGPELTVNFSLIETAPMLPETLNNDDNNNVAAQKIYGAKTVGIMINQALKSASLVKTGMYRSTAYFEALLERKLKITAKAYKIAALIIILLFVILITGLGLFTYKAGLINDSQSGTLMQIKKTKEPVAIKNRNNIFLLAGLSKQFDKNSTDYVGFCTAFAIDSSILVTDAHCIKKAEQEFQKIYVLLNEHPGKIYKVTKMRVHPNYNPNKISIDIGILKINNSLDSYATRATKKELQQINPGTPISMYGFPYPLNNLAQPVATFSKGSIGRVTTIDLKVGSFHNTVLLQHSATTSEGTSGSPVFNSAGHVIGVNVGGYTDNNKKLAGYNLGIRIDMLKPLLENKDQL